MRRLGQARGVRRARIEIGRDEVGHLGGDQAARGRVVGLAQEVRDGRQQPGVHLAAHSQGFEACIGEDLQVINALGLEFDGELHPAQGMELIGVDAQPIAELLGPLQVAPAGSEVEGPLLDEDVGGLGQLLLADRRQDLFAKQIEIAIRRFLMFQRDHMRRQTGGAHLHAGRGGGRVDRAQRLAFVLEAQPVTRLRFAGGRPVALHATEMGRDAGREFFLAGLAHGAHRGVNPPAARGDLEVVEALGAPVELLRPARSEGRVSVRIHESG